MIGINLSRVVNNPRLQSPFQIVRNLYEAMNEGEWTLVSTETYDQVGVVTPADANDVALYLPEGQRQHNAITLFSPVAIYKSDGAGQESDVIIWNGSYYRVQFSKPFEAYGYWFAIATGFVYAA